MTDFKAKMHQIRFRLGLRPRPRWGSLERSPDPLAGFEGRFAAGGGAGLGKRRESGGRWEVEGGKGRSPKLLLTQGPSEPGYATDVVQCLVCDPYRSSNCKSEELDFFTIIALLRTLHDQLYSPSGRQIQ